MVSQYCKYFWTVSFSVAPHQDRCMLSNWPGSLSLLVLTQHFKAFYKYLVYIFRSALSHGRSRHEVFSLQSLTKMVVVWMVFGFVCWDGRKYFGWLGDGDDLDGQCPSDNYQQFETKITICRWIRRPLRSDVPSRRSWERKSSATIDLSSWTFCLPSFKIDVAWLKSFHEKCKKFALIYI